MPAVINRGRTGKEPRTEDAAALLLAVPEAPDAVEEPVPFAGDVAVDEGAAEVGAGEAE